jgi:hypothetical protein
MAFRASQYRAVSVGARRHRLGVVRGVTVLDVTLLIGGYFFPLPEWSSAASWLFAGRLCRTTGVAGGAPPADMTLTD